MPAVLIAGLDPSAPEALRSINADALRKLLNEAEKKVHAAGYDAKVLYIFPKDGVEHFKKALEEKEWDTVMIGAGVRFHQGLTEFWEELLNAAHLALPGKPLCFNSRPHDMLEAIQRVCPI